MSVGENIKTYREKNGLSQPQLAEKLNISFKTISSWELNRTEPNIGMLIRISEIFNVCVDDLIENTRDCGQNNFKMVAYSPNPKEQKLIDLIKETILPNEKIDILIGMIESWK